MMQHNNNNNNNNMDFDPLPVNVNYHHAGSSTRTANFPCSSFHEEFGDAISLLDVLGGEDYRLDSMTTREHYDDDPTASDVFQWDMKTQVENQRLVQQEDKDMYDFLSVALTTLTPEPSSVPSSVVSPPPVVDRHYDQQQQFEPSRKRAFPGFAHNVDDHGERRRYYHKKQRDDSGSNIICPASGELIPAVLPMPTVVLANPLTGPVNKLANHDGPTMTIHEKKNKNEKQTTSTVVVENNDSNDDYDYHKDDNKPKSDHDENQEEETPTFSSFQIDRWDERFKELVVYKKQFGHCCVPNSWKPNYQLAQWVKRQRYQLRLKNKGKFSTLTQERKEELDKLGFVWDVQAAIWEERLADLHEFARIHGHCKVPIRYPENPELAIWAKCQRRHFKDYCEYRLKGKKWTSSTMSEERIVKLAKAGFVFSNRSTTKRTPSSSSSSVAH